MKVNEISVERKFNVGNYESFTVKVSVSPEQSEQSEEWKSVVATAVAELDEVLRNSIARKKEPVVETKKDLVK